MRDLQTTLWGIISACAIAVQPLLASGDWPDQKTLLIALAVGVLGYLSKDGRASVTDK